MCSKCYIGSLVLQLVLNNGCKSWRNVYLVIRQPKYNADATIPERLPSSKQVQI